MLLSLAVGATALFYLGAIPVNIVLRLNTESAKRFGFGISIFETRFAQRQSEKIRSRPLTFHLPDAELLPDLLHASLSVLKTLRPDELRLSGRFSAGDAAATALLCGLTDAVGQSLRCATGTNIHLHLSPDFSSPRFRAELSGIISVRTGHIIFAALAGALEYANRRLSPWTDIRLKAS